MYVSRWADAEKAADFARVYSNSLAKRYQHVEYVAIDSGKSAASQAQAKSWTGTRQWMTEEGAVTIEVENDKVLVTESLDAAARERLSHDVFANVLATK
jgi:zona occludens toxin (predicted ATPase)